MIVRVGLVRRAIRSLPLLDYAVPDELASTIHIGSLIRVPLRTTHAYGIVFSIHETSQTQKLKTLVDVVGKLPFLSPVHIHLATVFARWYGTSMHTIVKMLMLPMQKRKIAALELTPLPKTHKFKGTTTSSYYTDEQQQADLIENAVKNHEGQILILEPNMIELSAIEAELQARGLDVLAWHGRLSQKEQFERWTKVRNNQARVIIGTRSAVFLPFVALEAIITDQSHHLMGYKQWDGTPRFSAHDISKILAKGLGVSLYNYSFVPSIEDVAQDESVAQHIRNIDASIVNVDGAHAAQRYEAMSPSAVKAISKADCSLVLLNRKGFARSLRCLLCGHVTSCTTCDIPLAYHKQENILRCNSCRYSESVSLACPSCNGAWLKLRGYGTEYIADELSKALPDHIISVADAATVSQIDLQKKHHIIVGTTAILSLIRAAKPDVIVYVDIDAQLSLPEVFQTEELYYQLQEISFLVPAALLLLQTRNPEHSFFASLQDPSQWYGKVLKTRTLLFYPPYATLVRYSVGAKSLDAAKQRAAEIIAHVEQILTTSGTSITLSDPYTLQPRYHRGQYWYGILAKITEENWENTLLWLNGLMPTDIQIDPLPIRIISK